jgi:hypothetical protein
MKSVTVPIRKTNRLINIKDEKIYFLSVVYLTNSIPVQTLSVVFLVVVKKLVHYQLQLMTKQPDENYLSHVVEDHETKIQKN